MKRHRSQPEWTSAGFISDDLTIKQNENNNTSFKDYNLMHKKKVWVYTNINLKLWRKENYFISL